jgi:hypothetical protein
LGKRSTGRTGISAFMWGSAGYSEIPEPSDSLLPGYCEVYDHHHTFQNENTVMNDTEPIGTRKDPGP